MPEQNMTGAYAPFLDALQRANEPGLLSYRRPEFQHVEEWRVRAWAKALECVAMVDTGGLPRVETIARNLVGDLEAEVLRWQLPYGAPTEAVLLKPRGARGPLPGVLALHDHGGTEFFGRHKISEDGFPNHPMVVGIRELLYDGTAWANELARRGYVVLCHDGFSFGSRRVRVADTGRLWGYPEAVDPSGPFAEIPEQQIQDYNSWALHHEHVLAKCLYSAGTTWPGMFVAEDRRALDVLCARPEVDPQRVGCCGLSGGGCRTVYLAGLDDRIAAAICVAMMTTWRDLTVYHALGHTWMMWTPGLPKYLDYPEILGLRLPKPTLVLNNNQDRSFDLSEMKRADEQLRAMWDKAGASGNYVCNFYDGLHKFDRPMQADAWAWFDRWLKA